MLKTTYKKRSILIALLISFVFTFNIFAQSARERAIKLKQEGDAYFNKKEYESAIQSYLKAIEADNTYPDIYSSIGLGFSRSHQHKFAGEAYDIFIEKVTEAGTKNTVAITYYLYLIGNEYRLAKEFELSNQYFDSAIKVPPKYVEDYVAISDIYSYRNDLNSSIEYQIKAINLSNSDDDSITYSNLSWSYSFLHKNQEAVNAASRSIAINDKFPMAYTNRCRAYNDLKQYNDAIADCKKALSLQANHGETQYYLANALRGKGDTAEADKLNKLAIPNLIKELDEARELETINLPDYYYITGNAFFKIEDYATAIRAYEFGMEFKPNFPRLRFNLGLAYLSVNNKEGAMEQYRALKSIDSAKAAELKEHIDAAK